MANNTKSTADGSVKAHHAASPPNGPARSKPSANPT
jgi:hypothetical protein